jgi:ABC-2 type transport system permease protein
MNKTLLVFKHEFRQTVRRIGFIILAVALPLLGLLGIGIYKLVAGAVKPTTQITTIGYVDQVGDFGQFSLQGNINFVPFDSQDMATQALVAREIKEFFVIPADFVASGMLQRYTTQRELQAPESTLTAMKNFISSNLLAGKVPYEVTLRIEAPLSVSTTTLTSSGAVAAQQGGYENFLVPGIFALLLGLALVFTSIYVLRSLSEEKENRLMEILLSSVSPRQLLTGKVLGRGAAGFVQIIIWLISIPLLLRLASSSIGGLFSRISLPAGFYVLAVVYFILGYLFFAVISAAIAAVSSSVQEAQGMSTIYTLFNFVPFWFLSLLLLAPNSPVWTVFSIFPLTAPVSVILRLGLTTVPTWQLAASIAVLILSIIGGLLLSARLLRAYVLMYGKRPAFGQIMRILRYG